MTSLPPANLHRKSTKGKIALKYLTAVKTPGSSIQLQTFVRRCRIQTSRLLKANQFILKTGTLKWMREKGILITVRGVTYLLVYIILSLSLEGLEKDTCNKS